MVDQMEEMGRLEVCADAEVGNHEVAVVGNHDVVRFDVLMDERGRHGVQPGQSAGHVAQQVPGFFLREAAHAARYAALAAIGQNEVGFPLAAVVVERFEEVFVVGVDHDGELAGKDVESVVVEPGGGGVDFQGHFHVGLRVLGLPHFREAAAPQQAL